MAKIKKKTPSRVEEEQVPQGQPSSTLAVTGPPPPNTTRVLTPSEPSEMEKIYEEIMTTPVDVTSPDFKKASMSQEQVSKVLDTLSSTFDMPKTLATVAVILLFLLGAASGTPVTLSVNVGVWEISKRDLLNAYTLVTNNKFLRRMAEAMAVTIGKYAEKNGLKGELAQKITIAYKAETGENLSARELAWCSSFNQNI